jgi:hypothetical protein
MNSPSAYDISWAQQGLVSRLRYPDKEPGKAPKADNPAEEDLAD